MNWLISMIIVKRENSIWNYRSIIFLLSINDLKLRYRSSVLGIIWNFLEPLLILTILFFVFSNILKTDIENYPLFLLIGIITFQMFSRTTSMGLDSVLIRAGMISSIKLPVIIFPIASTLTSFYMVIFEFIILAIFMIIFQFIPPMTIVILPALLGLLILLGLGISIPLSVLNIHYRDLRSIWTIVLQAAFFLNPVIYTLDILPESISNILQYSPLAQLITMIRDVTLYGQIPNVFWLSYVVGAISCILVLGLVIFKHYRTNLVERF